jgi:6-phosphofructokinase
MSRHGAAATGDFASQAHRASNFGHAKRGFVKTATDRDTGSRVRW